MQQLKTFNTIIVISYDKDTEEMSGNVFGVLEDNRLVENKMATTTNKVRPTESIIIAALLEHGKEPRIEPIKGKLPPAGSRPEAAMLKLIRDLATSMMVTVFASTQ